jgi:hypothetical protein
MILLFLALLSISNQYLRHYPPVSEPIGLLDLLSFYQMLKHLAIQCKYKNGPHDIRKMTLSLTTLNKMIITEHNEILHDIKNKVTLNIATPA